MKGKKDLKEKLKLQLQLFQCVRIFNKWLNNCRIGLGILKGQKKTYLLTSPKFK